MAIAWHAGGKGTPLDGMHEQLRRAARWNEIEPPPREQMLAEAEHGNRGGILAAEVVQQPAVEATGGDGVLQGSKIHDQNLSEHPDHCNAAADQETRDAKDDEGTQRSQSTQIQRNLCELCVLCVLCVDRRVYCCCVRCGPRRSRKSTVIVSAMTLAYARVIPASAVVEIDAAVS